MHDSLFSIRYGEEVPAIYRFFRHFVNYWKTSYISADKNDPLCYNEQLKGCGRHAHVHKQ
jgi:hypothetical protein